MNRKNESDRIYDMLKKRIIYLEYEPGMVLNEVDIANEFNISRTPIREIFQQLSRDNLLNIIPRFGAQVYHIDFKYMKSVFEVTREFEPFAVKLATPRISEGDIKKLEDIMKTLNSYDIDKDYKKAIIEDEKFHQTVLKNCNNPCLQKILSDLHIHTERLWHYSEQYIDSMDIFTDTLGNVLDAIKEKDLSKVEKFSREHIDTFVQKIKEEML
ncbi:GntR family transcriptional regulator [Clostridium fallax]|uniref:DNA-binding transcriptional regulator, GntR family n=1 Tax=Clostridium fallax TaxID=1533 RepID=A0A1M4XFP1_9CLOT|nr:GntR family transcriptional regulator [Clostridium fallax]SHE92374.1 DNA-binding transcriptional regulator, GntR family [Clostridium fallax]SQB06415.1 GntR family transcriptional regulator [Clostridium fallax]